MGLFQPLLYGLISFNQLQILRKEVSPATQAATPSPEVHEIPVIIWKPRCRQVPPWKYRMGVANTDG